MRSRLFATKLRQNGAKEAVMSGASNRRSGMFGRLVEWRRNLGVARARLGESLSLDGRDGMGHIARNRYTIPAKRPDGAYYLRKRLEVLHTAMRP
jgi:hypothetical protein